MTDTSLPDRIQTEDPSFVRDTHSRALLNTDAGALARHRRNIAKAKASAGTLASLQVRQHALEERLDEVTTKLDLLIDHLLKR
jgi:hypothetical protein